MILARRRPQVAAVAGHLRSQRLRVVSSGRVMNMNTNFKNAMTVMMTLLVSAVFYPQLAVGGAGPSPESQCRHFQQTGGCDPAGAPEGKQPCSASIQQGVSGYCDCGPSIPRWDVTCQHDEFRCTDACFLALEKKKAEDAGHAAGAFNDCFWLQTGGCNPSGPREAHSDKSCDAWIERGASGYCLCPSGRREAGSTCSHTPFRCRDECMPANLHLDQQRDELDDKLYNALRGTKWQLNDGRQATFEAGKGVFDTPSCKSSNHRECLWNVYRGNVVIEWGRRGVFLATPQQAASDAPADGNDAEDEDFLPSVLTGESISNSDNPRRPQTFSATLLERDSSDDYYTALGLSDTADKSEIKKAYRRMSVRYHPDKNPGPSAAAKFNTIRTAYEVLSNDEKRRVYDTGGAEAVTRLEKGEVRRTRDSQANLDITLEQVYTGTTVHVSVKRRIVCRGCATRRSAACKQCGDCPPEVRTVKRRVGPFLMNQQEQVPSAERCKNEPVTLEVVVEKGIATGHEVKFEGKGEQKPGEIPGNMVLKLNIKKHAQFERAGKNDLRIHLKLSLKEALLGFEHRIPHLDGHEVVVKRETITKVGDVMRIQREGMPHHNMASSHGDLLVHLDIEMPVQLTQQQRQLVADVF